MINVLFAFTFYYLIILTEMTSDCDYLVRNENDKKMRNFDEQLTSAIEEARDICRNRWETRFHEELARRDKEWEAKMSTAVSTAIRSMKAEMSDMELKHHKEMNKMKMEMSDMEAKLQQNINAVQTNVDAVNKKVDCTRMVTDGNGNGNGNGILGAIISAQLGMGKSQSGNRTPQVSEIHDGGERNKQRGGKKQMAKESKQQKQADKQNGEKSNDSGDEKEQ